MSNFTKIAITRMQTAVIIGVIVLAIVAGGVYTSMQPSQPAQMSTTAAQGGSKIIDTLTMSAAFWPLDDLNQLYSVGELPWPNPLAFTVYQPLVTMNMTAEFQQGTVQFLPGLATWTVSPDGKTYTFSLKQNTIVFQLVAPFVWFPGTLVVYEGLIYDTQWLLQNGGFGTPTAFNSYFNQHPIPGTGPYVVTTVSENSYVKFAQNPTYWGANLTADEIAQQPLFDPGHARTVIVDYKPDDVARYTDLSTGAAQVADIETPDWNLITQNPQTYSYFHPPSWSGEVALLGLNTHEYPTDNKLVRQAIVHALNYTDIAAKAYGGQLSPYVGPEYPWWKDYYDLGNYPPYQYNLTLANQLLAEAHITNMPTFLLRVESGCPLCVNAAQVIQSDLAMIGINVNIAVIQPSLYNTQLGSYQTNVANAAQLGQLEYVNSGFGWGPATVTPTDYWVTFVSNQSAWGNYAAYYNPTVQKAVNSFFTNSSNPAYLQSLVAAAQAQIYEDAPYAWLGTFGLWLPWGGSIVWKTGVISGFLVDPVWTGQATEPIFNTVTFGPDA